MQLIYLLPALIVGVVVSVFASPIIGIIVFVVLVGGTLLIGGAGGRHVRTSNPEPTGRPRASQAGVETSNQRQGQD
jgi:hypothetical protein